MRSLVRRIRDYPALTGALVAAAVGGGLDLAGYHVWAQWGISAFAILVALLEGVAMVRSIVRGKWGIDVLAITAIVATVVVGEYWAALIIVIMFTGGEALETFAAGRAKRELTALLNRTPLIAHRLKNDEPEDVPVGEVELGDRLIVRPGELVPVDGILESAAATLDESSLTGESLPVDRHAGDSLFSGAVNGSSVLTMRVTARAEDSQYQRIVALVAEAAESKAPFVRMADRYAVPFTVAAYVFAVAGWIWSGEASRFAEVLVVATPCPLIIATPVAFIAGMSRQARNGVIVKNGGTLEKLARIRTAAFDKTGTLTYGQPALAGIHAQKDWHDNDLLAIVASAEQYSAHTLAQSIVTSTRFLGLPLSPATDVVEMTAHGLTATVAKR
ncbi:MAG: HAD-IC family P-type ATPase, partial [Actinobacteria bacterium]|nr:HAD-IC family P-type ATPase [Actinomycetota bacterium]